MRRWFVLALLLLSALPLWAAGLDTRLCFPASLDVEGWVRAGSPRTFTPKDLYEYIDGAADLFNSYGFQELSTEAYRGDGGRRITVDIYTMASPLDAFGVFTSERPPQARAVKFGVAGYSDSGLTAFWQGPYYVKASVTDPADAASAEELARGTSAKLPRGTGRPEELKRLPTQGLVADSEKYVRQSALGHKFLNRDLSGEYTLGKATGELHVVDLVTFDQAADAWLKLRDFEAKAGATAQPVTGVGEGAYSLKDESLGQLVAARQGRFLVLGLSEKASRATVISLVRQAVTALRRQQGRSQK